VRVIWLVVIDEARKGCNESTRPFLEVACSDQQPYIPPDGLIEGEIARATNFHHHQRKTSQTLLQEPLSSQSHVIRPIAVVTGCEREIMAQPGATQETDHPFNTFRMDSIGLWGLVAWSRRVIGGVGDH
jgi:hypothetical protein